MMCCLCCCCVSLVLVGMVLSRMCLVFYCGLNEFSGF